MKAQTKWFILLAIVLVALMNTGCGGSSGNSNPGPAAALGTPCGSGGLQSQWGCLPQCGPNSVIYNGQCMPIQGAGGYGGYPGSGYPGSGYPGSGYPGGYGGTPQICQGNCPPGLVSVQGGYACLPQNSCGACYGYYNGMCYIGDYAHQYYGY